MMVLDGVPDPVAHLPPGDVLDPTADLLKAAEHSRRTGGRNTVRTAVTRFFDENQKWLASVLTQGQADKSLTVSGAPDEIAQGILSMLEGAMLVARPYGDLKRFDAATWQLLGSLIA
jgi:hypothetical protein